MNKPGMSIEMARAELQAAMSGPAGRHWNYGPAVSTVLAVLEQAEKHTAELLERRERAAVELAVWYGSMPESNGKTNWTAIVHRKGECISKGITIDRSEYPDRVRYEADRVRYLIGELADKPCITSYDANKHSGYVAPKPEPVVPKNLPCPVLLEPGLRFGKGVPTQTMLDALQRRAEYYAELEAMTPEQRADHDAGMKEFAAMLQSFGNSEPLLAQQQPVSPPYKLVGEVVQWDAPQRQGVYRNVDFRWIDFDVAPGTLVYAVYSSAVLPAEWVAASRAQLFEKIQTLATQAHQLATTLEIGKDRTEIFEIYHVLNNLSRRGYAEQVGKVMNPLLSHSSPVPVLLRDDQIRDLVNELRDIAVDYLGTQQLRERLARAVRKAIYQTSSVSDEDVL